ncbi:FAS1 domain-containing protein [Phellopilus nigrolimitatus]|nr:FAS1 domain-containing protein [Phellopilus nigrolimitatus]
MLLCLVVATFAGVLAVFALHDQPAFYAQGDKDAYTVHWDADPAHAAAPPIVGASGGNKYWQENNAVHPHHFPSARPPKKPNGTIYSALSENSAFSRLLKVVNISDEIISVLNDSSITLTFFALPNQAIPKPLTHKQPSRKETLDFAGTDVSLTELVTHVESFDTADMDAQSRPQKEVIKKIVTAVLSYHILPDSLDVAALKKNTTYATKLSRVFGALNDGPLRLRVGSALPFVRINSYSDVIVPDIKATNGLIHVVDRPLIIPSSVFQKLFLLQHEFSTLSSAIQRTGLTDVVDYKLIHRSFVELPATVGSPVVTIFAPSNKAFAKLPKKLQLFLFSPFGKRALKKILQYHVVPNVTLHSGWLHTSVIASSLQKSFRPKPHLPKRPTHAPHAKPEFIANYTLPTALANHTLNVLVVRLPIRLPFPRHSQRIGHVTRMILNGQPVKLHDGVALNGAIHIIDRLLSPHPLKGRPEHGRPRPPPAQENIFESYDAEHAGENNLDDWEDWELWLPAWAEEN